MSSSKQFDKGPDEVSQKQEQSPQEALAAKTAIKKNDSVKVLL